MRRVLSHICCCIASLVFASEAGAQLTASQTDFVRATLEWRTIETEHFKINYHESVADNDTDRAFRVAQTVATIAESVYGPITNLYAYQPETVSIVLKDFEDYSNGAAYFFDNVIEIWLPSLDSPLRGDHDWFENVIAHEFTHIVQVQKTLKSGRQNPFQYFQWFGYENVKRPDVLYGYPNRIVTYPIPAISNPAWFAEGTAQFQRSDFSFDVWDSHRDMLLRSRVLANDQLSLADMGGFYTRNSFDRESIYNHGFAFTLYLTERYGEDVLRRISHELGSWKNYNFERAFRKATGERARDVHSDWVAELRASYETVKRSVDQNPGASKVVFSEGFVNAYPSISPDGSMIGFATNSGQDYSAQSIKIMGLKDSALVRHDVPLDAIWRDGHTCAFGSDFVKATTGSFDWLPDSRSIVFSRRRVTPEGFLFNDLYQYSLDTRNTERLTHGLRASHPAVNKAGNKIAFLRLEGGQTILSVLDLESLEIANWFTPRDDRQLYEPIWFGDEVIASISKKHGRDIVAISEDGELRELVATPADERSAVVSRAGDHLIYSSDATGIFNLYRLNVHNNDDAPIQITNVLGGAFMPAVGPIGEIYFSNFTSDGYEIAQVVEEPSAIVADRSAVVPIFLKKGEVADAIPQVYGNLESQNYSNTFTSFSFYPVVRLDQYVSREQSRGNVKLPKTNRVESLWRNTKVGFYTGSREIMGNLSIFAGALVGPGSRKASSFGDFISPASLLELERDLFMQFEYGKGLLFKGKRWSPRFSAELYNIRRNVDDGLSIEEFSCTACFPPDTTFADISYNLWQVNLVSRSKLSRFSVVELGYRFSPYSVTTDDFFSTEFGQNIPKSSSRYYIGRAFSARFSFDAPVRHRHANVAPAGFRGDLLFDYEPGRLLREFEVQEGFLEPVYQRYRVKRVVADLRYGKLIGRRASGGTHSLRIRLRASDILGERVDSFFDDYVGGLTGARGYPFYSLGGNTTIWGQFSYNFPISPEFRRQLGFLYVDKIYGRVFFDAANAWTGSSPGFSDIKTDVGLELRVGMGSFYLLPSALFVSGTYGLKQFDFEIDEDFVSDRQASSVTYGKELLFHFGILFDFEL